MDLCLPCSTIWHACQQECRPHAFVGCTCMLWHVHAPAHIAAHVGNVANARRQGIPSDRMTAAALNGCCSNCCRCVDCSILLSCCSNCCCCVDFSILLSCNCVCETLGRPCNAVHVVVVYKLPACHPKALSVGVEACCAPLGKQACPCRQ